MSVVLTIRHCNSSSNRSPYRMQCNSSSNRSPYRIQCISSSNRSPYRIQCDSNSIGLPRGSSVPITEDGLSTPHSLNGCNVVIHITTIQEADYIVIVPVN